MANGKLLAGLAGILAGVGMIVDALAITGMMGITANDLVRLAGGHILALLAMDAVTSFILGIGMTVTASYILLAVVIATALVKVGLDSMAVHLFILLLGDAWLYHAPVALGAAAASIAKAKPFKTGLYAMHLGSMIDVFPFLFVLEPALLALAGWTRLPSPRR